MKTKRKAVTGKKVAAKKKAAKKVDPVCLACDGTGQTCNICGDSESMCACDAAEVERHQEENDMDQFDDCETCKGTGK